MAQTAQKESQLAVLERAARLPYHPGIKERFGIDAGAWRTLVEAIFPAAKTADAVLLALDYCKARNLDPFKRPVHIVPMWSQAANNGRGGYVETVWPGIWEMRATAFRTKQYAGMDEPDFGPMQTRDFKGVQDVWEQGRKTGTKEIGATLTFPEWCRCTVYRDLGGRLCKFVGPKVFWLESYATVGKTDVPNDMWRERPSGQIEKCAESAALRRAFPEELGNELSADEMSGRVIDAEVPVAVASSAQETKAIMSPPPIPEAPTVKPEAPVVKVVPPAETTPPEYPELPAILDRRQNAPGPIQPGDGEGVGKEESATRVGGSSEPPPEPPPFDSDGALRAIQEACENASSEDQVEEVERMYGADMDAMSRNERQIGEVAIGEAYERLRRATPPAPPPSDPFAVPSFRGAADVSAWVEKMVAETKSYADALRLREAFNVSKAERARFLGGPEYDRLVMLVKTAWLHWQPKDNPSPEGPPPIPPAKADDGIPKTWTEYCEKTREVMRNATTTKEIQVDWLLKTVELRQRLWPSLQAYEDGLKREIRTRLDELYGR